MRTPTALLVAALLGGAAVADCPPDCVGGGGPPETDCFVVFSGIPATTASCTDGEACDMDGKVDGVCTLDLQACINVPGLGSCTPRGLSGRPTVKPSNGPTAQQLQNALAALDPSAEGCTPPGLAVPLKVSLAGIKPATARLTITATSGGKHVKDKLRLTCQPNSTAPSFAQDVQPIFTKKCAYSGCHDAGSRFGQQVLDPGVAYTDTWKVPSSEVPNLVRVMPGSIKKSFLARKIIGKGIPNGRGGGTMPFGCPGVPPLNGCLTQQELGTILSWIANGAPDN